MFDLKIGCLSKNYIFRQLEMSRISKFGQKHGAIYLFVHLFFEADMGLILFYKISLGSDQVWSDLSQPR